MAFWIICEACTKSLAEMNRTLKVGAKILASFISENDSAYGQGKKIDTDTWVIEEGYEAGAPQAFFSLEKVMQTMSDFEVLSVVEVSHNAIFGRSLIGTDKHYAVDSRYMYCSKK